MRRISVVLMLTLILAACGGSPAPQTSTDPTSPPAAPPSPQATATPEPTEAPTSTPRPTNTPAPTDTPEPTATPTELPTPTPPPEPVVFEGAGQTVTDPFTPPSGVYRVTLTHNGERNFIVHVFFADGDDDSMVNEIGPYQGSRPLIGGKEVFFEVDADGAWTIRVEPLVFDEVAAQGIEGTGDQVSGLFTPLRQGPVPYAFTHNGERNFIVHLYCAGGDDSVQNEIGPVDGEAVARFEDAPCFWEVEADGDWSIRPK
jgi:hypothetical protein